MRSRALNKKIEVWQTRNVADGYGGNTQTDNLIDYTWASVKTITTNKISELGLDYTKEVLQITVRKREDFNYNSKTIYIKYRDNNYTISSFPSNKDFTDAFITFLAVQQKPSDLPTYETIV